MLVRRRLNDPGEKIPATPATKIRAPNKVISKVIGTLPVRIRVADCNADAIRCDQVIPGGYEMPLVYENILATIGKTPIVRLNKIAPEHVNLYVKIE